MAIGGSGGVLHAGHACPADLRLIELRGREQHAIEPLDDTSATDFACDAHGMNVNGSAYSAEYVRTG